MKGVGGGGDSDTGIIDTVTIILVYSGLINQNLSFIQRVILSCLMSVFRVGDMQTYTAAKVSHLGVHHVMNSGISI